MAPRAAAAGTAAIPPALKSPGAPRTVLESLSPALSMFLSSSDPPPAPPNICMEEDGDGDGDAVLDDATLSGLDMKDDWCCLGIPKDETSSKASKNVRAVALKYMLLN